MSETKREMRPVQVDYICDQCGKGRMRPSGTCFTSLPPLYPHLCSNEDCKHSQAFRCMYPSIVWEPIPDE